MTINPLVIPFTEVDQFSMRLQSLSPSEFIDEHLRHYRTQHGRDPSCIFVGLRLFEMYETSLLTVQRFRFTTTEGGLGRTGLMFRSLPLHIHLP